MASERSDVTRTESPRELQRDLDKTRDSIAQTVTEIQNTMVTEYQQMKSNVSQTLDWRTQIERHPVAFVAGALVLGLLIGRRVGGQMSGGDHDSSGSDYSSGYDDYSSPSYSSSLAGEMPEHTSRPRGPGRASRVMNSVRQTQVYDQFQTGISKVLSEVVDEFVRTSREVIIPQFMSKFMDKVGVDRNEYESTHQRGTGTGTGQY